jgi:hypothetical protein
MAMVKVQNQATGGARTIGKSRKAGNKAGQSPFTDGRNHVQRGGELPPQVLKALVSNLSSVHDFHKLGDTVSLPSSIQKIDLDNLSKTLPANLSPEDVNELTTLAQQRNTLLARKASAQNRHHIVLFATRRRDLKIAHMGVKRSGWCGHDSDTVLPAAQLAARVLELGLSDGNLNESLLGQDGGEVPDSVCTRKNCNVHPKWWDMERQDASQELRMWARKLEDLEDRVLGIGEAAARKGHRMGDIDISTL